MNDIRYATSSTRRHLDYSIPLWGSGAVFLVGQKILLVHAHFHVLDAILHKIVFRIRLFLEIWS